MYVYVCVELMEEMNQLADEQLQQLADQVSQYTCMRVCMHKCVHECVCVHMCMRMYVCTYVRAHVCTLHSIMITLGPQDVCFTGGKIGVKVQPLNCLH